MNKAAIILVAPQMGENIGAAARVMKNFGLNDLRIINPRDGWPNEKAQSMSVGAIDIVNNAKIYNNLKDALLDIEFLYATTAVSRDMNKATITSKEIANDYPYGLKVAIMFGRESSGLTNNEISISNKIININTSDFSSLNIAQAIGILCYELYNNINNDYAQDSDIATKNDFLLFCEHLEIELERKNFFKIVEKKPKMMQNIINIFNRIDKLSKSELQTLRGIIKSLSR